MTTNLAANTLGGQGDVADYWALLKPRVMSLVVFTAIVGLFAAPGTIHPVVWLHFILCIALGAGASGALNMWYDADIDAIMKRTSNASRAAWCGDGIRGSGLWSGTVGRVGADDGPVRQCGRRALLAFTIAFYVIIYSMWLKRRTPQNIVIGGAAGAFPPMVAWTAVTGTRLTSAALHSSC